MNIAGGQHTTGKSWETTTSEPRVLRHTSLVALVETCWPHGPRSGRWYPACLGSDGREVVRLGAVAWLSLSSGTRVSELLMVQHGTIQNGWCWGSPHSHRTNSRTSFRESARNCHSSAWEEPTSNRVWVKHVWKNLKKAGKEGCYLILIDSSESRCFRPSGIIVIHHMRSNLFLKKIQEPKPRSSAWSNFNTIACLDPMLWLAYDWLVNCYDWKIPCKRSGNIIGSKPCVALLGRGWSHDKPLYLVMCSLLMLKDRGWLGMVVGSKFC